MKRKREGGAKVRFAVIGQGPFAQTTLLPAFANARRAQLTAIFTDDETRLAALRRKYRVEHALPYTQLDEFLRSGAVEAVYIAVPNNLHAELTERAAAAGVHVLCEKPIASSSAHAERMIAACGRARVKLMIAYRSHFEQATRAAVKILRSGKIGDPRYLSAIFSQQLTAGNRRARRGHAGGPLRDLGITCINAARTLFQDEPIEATAMSGTRAGDRRFREIDEQVSALLKFPGDRLAHITCSFGAADLASCTVLGTKGRLRLEPAFDRPDLALTPEIDELAACIREGRDPEPSGREGLADLRVIEAIEVSARSGTRVFVDRVFPPARSSMHSHGQRRHTRTVFQRPRRNSATDTTAMTENAAVTEA
jgi:glucose-fructose oxidoreductase